MSTLAPRARLSGNERSDDRTDRQARAAFLFFMTALVVALVAFLVLPFLG